MNTSTRNPWFISHSHNGQALAVTPHCIRKSALAVAVAAMFTLSSAHAANFNWSLGSGGDWNTASNWGGTVPNATDANVTIGTLSAGSAVNISSSVTISQLVLNGSNPVSLTASAGQALTFGGAAGSVINCQGNYTIDADIIWAMPSFGNVSVSTGKTLTINGAITNLTGGWRQFVATGEGKTVLTNVNNNISQLLIQQGETEITSIAAIGGGFDTKIGQGSNKATLTYTGAAASFANRVILSSQIGSVINSSGAGTLTFTNSIFNDQTTINSVGTTLVLGGGTSGVINGKIQNNLGTAPVVNLVKQDANTWTLAGANTYTGTTTVNGGKLAVNGSLSASSAVTVNSGGTLGGSGTVGAVTVYGTLAPGNSIGTINTGNLTLGANGVLDVELGRNGANAISDRTNVTGTVDLVGGPNLKLTLYTGLTDPQEGDIFFLIANDDTDAINGVFTSLNGMTTTLTEGSRFSWNSQQWEITYNANSEAATPSFAGGNDAAIMAVPEPATWSMIIGGLGMLLGCQRLRRRSK